MRCETCEGEGFVEGWVDTPVSIGPFTSKMGKAWFAAPCPDCGGSGVVHCCDGPVGRALDEPRGEE